MRRLFSSWDTDEAGVLGLQNVVSGLARIKGTRDIMSTLSYFFDLYDDDRDGKVDREGILRISEALLFLSRRGLSGGPSPSGSTNNLAQSEFMPDGTPIRRENKDEQFLSSVSAFIRRCFEYADPDQAPAHANDSIPVISPALAPQEEELENPDAFSIGDDDDDLLDLGDQDSAKPISAASTPTKETQPDLSTSLTSPTSDKLAFGQTTSNKNAAANAALDPNHPLYITLPTFRMVVLADEVLESFFDSGFPNSFHLADAPLPSSTVTSTSNLTTFTSAMPKGVAQPAISPGGPGAGVVAPGKGLRGMLDNIVTDGMRVAAEVRRRMDEAQKELDRGAVTRGTEDEEDEDEGDEGGRDLLEGADAEAGNESATAQGKREDLPSLLDEPLVREPQGKGKEKEEPVRKDTIFDA